MILVACLHFLYTYWLKAINREQPQLETETSAKVLKIVLNQ